MSKHGCLNGFTCACGHHGSNNGFKAEEVRVEKLAGTGQPIPDDIAARIKAKDWDDVPPDEWASLPQGVPMKLGQ